MSGANKLKIQLGGNPALVPVPLEDGDGDDDLVLSSPSKKRGGEAPAEANRGGKREKSGGSGESVTIDVASLRNLLREQSDELMGRQKHQLDTAIAELEARAFGRVADLQDQVNDLEGKTSVFQDKLEALEKGLQDLTSLVQSRPLGGPAGSSEDGDLEAKRRCTLVVGGWPRDSRRKDVLKELSEAMEVLNISAQIDAAPFCTGPRRSVALVHMPKRAQETDQGHRDRMFGVVQAFAGTEVVARGGSRLWCSFSKTPEQRAISGHASLIKRLVKGFGKMEPDLLDVEWKTGSVWCDEGLVGSACLPCPPGTDMRGVSVFEDTPRKHWLNLNLLAKICGVNKAAVSKAVEEQRH